MPHRVFNEALRHLCRHAIEAHPDTLPTLQSVDLRHMPQQDEIEIRLRFSTDFVCTHRFSCYQLDRMAERRWRDVPPHEIHQMAMRTWVEMYGDTRVERELKPQRDEIDAALRNIPDAAAYGYVHHLQQRYELAEQALRQRMVQEQNGPQFYYETPRMDFGARRGNEPVTIHEVAVRRIEAQRAVEPLLIEGLRNFNRDVWTIFRQNYGVVRHFDNPFPLSGPSEAANKKALALLLDNLTPEQRFAYGEKKHFDVVGCDSGKTYRVHYGTHQNVSELDEHRNRVCGWCFLPRGGLAAGDVMLAQKNALELFESEALKVANRFR